MVDNSSVIYNKKKTKKFSKVFVFLFRCYTFSKWYCPVYTTVIFYGHGI